MPSAAVARVEPPDRVRLRAHRTLAGRPGEEYHGPDLTRVEGGVGDGIAGEIKVGRALDLDESVILFWKQGDDDPGLAARLVLLDGTGLHIGELLQLAMRRLEDAVDHGNMIIL